MPTGESAAAGAGERSLSVQPLRNGFGSAQAIGRIPARIWTFELHSQELEIVSADEKDQSLFASMNHPDRAAISEKASAHSHAETEASDVVRAALAVTLRGCEELLPRADWIRKLQRSEATGTPLRIKFGMDPTAPDLHLGHTVVQIGRAHV